MKTLKIALPIILISLFTMSCSTISYEVRKEAESSVPFKTVVEEINNYVGKTVILGGYILETNSLENETLITVIQAPLDMQDEPKSMDLTEGRFIVLQKGWLDPAVYRRDRAITVAGTVIDSSAEKIETCRYPCLKIKSREMHLVPEDSYYSRGYSWPSYNYGGYGSGGYFHSGSSGCR